jgi:hypothetical protein
MADRTILELIRDHNKELRELLETEDGREAIKDLVKLESELSEIIDSEKIPEDNQQRNVLRSAESDGLVFFAVMDDKLLGGVKKKAKQVINNYIKGKVGSVVGDKSDES